MRRKVSGWIVRAFEVVERLRPWRVASTRRARGLRGVRSGEQSRGGVQIGDRSAGRDGREVHAARIDHAAVASGDFDASGEPTRPADGRGGGQPARLRPLRILIISSDRRFRTVMSLLLARRNCAVTTTANASRVADLVRRENTDVVVIDVDEPFTAVTTAPVDTLARPIGVVLVADETSSPRPRTATLKWGPFEGLVEEIERAAEQRRAPVLRPGPSQALSGEPA